jgi:hypothetical protein
MCASLMILSFSLEHLDVTFDIACQILADSGLLMPPFYLIFEHIHPRR